MASIAPNPMAYIGVFPGTMLYEKLFLHSFSYRLAAADWDYLAASDHHVPLSGRLLRLDSIAQPPQSLSVTVEWRPSRSCDQRRK